MPMLSVTLTHSGYGHVTVLRDLGLVVDEGELVTVLGSNGAGKTTLLRTISGLLVRTDAIVEFDGDDVSRYPAHRRTRSGIIHVPEGRHAFPGLTVTENLEMGAYAAASRRASRDAAYDRVYELFPVLADRANQQATSLSGGQQQMLAIGRGLMAQPRLLMVDEPSLGLSPLLTQQVLDVLARICAQGTAVLMIEQNARAALTIAARAYVLERGAVAMAGAADDLLHDDRVAGLYLGGHPTKS